MALVLSWMVAMRFIGKWGIVQCSPFPLPSNPYDGIIKSAISLMKSPDNIIGNLANPPTVQPNPATVTVTTTLPKPHIRYNRPKLATIAIQITLHALGGFLYFKSTTGSIVANSLVQTKVAGWTTMNSCILLSIVTLFTSYVNHTSKNLPHEISIRGGNHMSNTLGGRYVQVVQEDLIEKLRQSKLCFFWIFTPIIVFMVVLAICAHTMVKTEGHVDIIGLMNTVQDVIPILLLSTYPKTLFLIIYTVILDILVRVTLVTKGVDIDRLLLANKTHRSSNSNATNENFTVEDLIMQSTLAGFGTGIVEAIVAPHSPQAVRNEPWVVFLGSGGIPVMDLEEKELHRNTAAKSCVADAIETGLVCGCTSLEDDLLRMLILESLGGTGDDELGETEGYSMTEVQQKESEITGEKTADKGDNAIPLGLSLRHYGTLKWIPRGQAAVPVVHAFCAYAGGLGEALQHVTAKLSSAETKTWSLSPCAFKSAEYAIVGAARLVALTLLDHPSRTIRKNHNRISLLVLVVLQSAHQLRCGLLEYAKYVMYFEGERSYVGKEELYHTFTVAGMNNLCKYIFLHNPDISHILKACDGAARQLLEVINYHSSANVGKDCNAWLKSLQ